MTRANTTLTVFGVISGWAVTRQEPNFPLDGSTSALATMRSSRELTCPSSRFYVNLAARGTVGLVDTSPPVRSGWLSVNEVANVRENSFTQLHG